MVKSSIISVATLLLVGLFAGDARADFSDTCWNLKIVNGSWLSATCRIGKDREHIGAHLNLNDIIANDNGTLNWRRGGNFMASCNNLEIVSEKLGRLAATCRVNNGMTVFAFINLGTHIDNVNGDLVHHVPPTHDEP